MESNPYTSPSTALDGQPSSAVQDERNQEFSTLVDMDVDELHEIARAQRKLISALLLSLLVMLLFLAPLPFIPLVYFAAAILVVSALLQLRRAITDRPSSPVMIVCLIIVPFVFWIVALICSQQATRRLREAGVRVGFFGAPDHEFHGLRTRVEIQRQKLGDALPESSAGIASPEPMPMPSFLSGKRDGETG